MTTNDNSHSKKPTPSNGGIRQLDETGRAALKHRPVWEQNNTVRNTMPAPVNPHNPHRDNGSKDKK